MVARLSHATDLVVVLYCGLISVPTGNSIHLKGTSYNTVIMIAHCVHCVVEVVLHSPKHQHKPKRNG